VALDISQFAISRVPDAYTKQTYRATVGGFIRAVKAGSYAATVKRIRHLIADGHDKDTVNNVKATLPAALFSGIYRRADGHAYPECYTGIVVADFDGLDPWEIEEYKGKLADIPACAGWFISPSGAGIKALMVTQARTAALHYAAYWTIEKHMAGLGMTTDERCKDHSRLCYISHDPEAVLRPCIPMPLAENAPTERPKPERCTEVVNALPDAKAEALGILAGMKAIQGKGGERTTWDAILLGRDYGIPEDEWTQAILEWNKTNAFPPWRAGALRAKIRSNYQGCPRAVGCRGIMAGLV